MKYASYRLLGIFFVICFTWYFALGNSTAYGEEKTNSLADDIKKADQVITLSYSDNVTAAKRVKDVFVAARRLYDLGDLEKAKSYYSRGLQLSPWNMNEQLAYAKLLNETGRRNQAIQLAQLVYQTTESESTLKASAELAEIKMSDTMKDCPGSHQDEKIICFVRIGDVDEWIVQAMANRLNKVLGVEVYVYRDRVELPDFHRSYLSRWITNISKDIVWDHPYVRSIMKEQKISDQKSATDDQIIELYAQLGEAQGHDNIRENLEIERQWAVVRDQQWDAEILLDTVKQIATKYKNVVLIGITGVDVYAQDSNYAFGFSWVGSEYALLSYKRFLASFNDEKENKTRLIERVYKQLITSVGFALGVPRPTEPGSVRSYSSSLSEHDQKGVWLSPTSISGFEEVLGRTLPNETTLPTLQP